MPRVLAPDDLVPLLLGRLAPAERQMLAVLRDAAGDAGSALYLVGGSVRDLLLGRDHVDLDFAVEADARMVASTVARRLAGHAVLHEAFRTATVTAGSLVFDLVTARREWYPAPGALPVVEPATIVDDMTRRDFSINAMALRLDADAGGELIDPHGGLGDLARGILRILHRASFRDDPTRLWRAGRYIARMHLTFDRSTAACATRDAAYMGAISPARVHHELQRTLAERRPDRAFAALDAAGVLEATLAGWTCTAAEAAAMRRAHAVRARYGEEVVLAVLFASCDEEQVEMAIDRLALVRRQATVLRALPVARAALHALIQEAATAGRAAPVLDSIPHATLAALAARWPASRAARMARAYLEQWRFVRPVLRPEQVQALGVPFGPRLGEALRLLRRARLDGRTRTAADEEELVRCWQVDEHCTTSTQVMQRKE